MTVDTTRKTFIKPTAPQSRRPDSRRRGNTPPIAPTPVPKLPPLAAISPEAERALAVNRGLNQKSRPVNRQDQGQARNEANLQTLSELKYVKEQLVAARKMQARLEGELQLKTAQASELATSYANALLASDIFEKNSAGAAALFEENIKLKAQVEELKTRLAGPALG